MVHFPPHKLKELMDTKSPLAKKHHFSMVKNIQLFGHMARAGLRTGHPKMRWTEYIHLVKEEGQWKLMTVFWEFSKKQP